MCLRTTRPAINLCTSRKFNALRAACLGLTLGSLRADEALFETQAYLKERALAFRTPVVELSPQVVFTPFGGLTEQARVSTCLTAGISMSWLNVQSDWSGFDAAYFSETETSLQWMGGNQRGHLRAAAHSPQSRFCNHWGEVRGGGTVKRKK